MYKILFFIVYGFNSLYAQTIEVSHPNPKFGVFSTYYLKVKSINDGTKRVKLLEDLIYIDPNGQRWRSPKGSIVDGASIPKVFQKVIGTPYGGEYTLASVIHDVACVEQKEPWQKVHRAFYDAMLASGVKKQKAATMYLAVYEAGGRWGNNTNLHMNHEEILNLFGVNSFQGLLTEFQPFVSTLLLNNFNIKDLNLKNIDLNQILKRLNIQVSQTKNGLVVNLGEK